MQLILNTGTTIEINEKMSLNEDNLEKETLDVISSVRNGDIGKDDQHSEDNGDCENNKKLKQAAQEALKTTELEIQQNSSDDIVKETDIESLHENDNKLNHIADIVNGKNGNTSNERAIETNNVHDCSENVETAANIIPDTSENKLVKDENGSVVDNAAAQNDVVNISTDTLSSENMDISDITDAKEDLSIQKEDTVSIDTDIVLSNEHGTVDNVLEVSGKLEDAIEKLSNESELNSENMDASNITDGNENFSLHKEDTVSIDTDIEINNEHGIDIVTNAIEKLEDAVEKESNGADNIKETEISCENENTNVIVDEHSTKNCEEVDYSNITADHDSINTSKISGKELNTLSSDIEEHVNDSVSSEKSILKEQTVVDTTSNIENIIHSNKEEKEDNDENIISTTTDVRISKENVVKADENCQENESMETDQTDKSDESIDLINLNVNNENVAVSECIKKDFEEKGKVIDVEEKETTDTVKDDIPIKSDLMELDENNLKESVLSPNKDSNCTATADCNLNEPIAEKNESVNLEDSSDDVIYNLDDDKEQETQVVNPTKEESTEVVNDNVSLVSSDIADSDSYNKISETSVTKQSDEIIDLDETVAKNVEARQENIQKTTEAPKIPPVLKLSNSLNILSDDEDEPKETKVESKCISIEDDDDVMLIDEDTSGNEPKIETTKSTEKEHSEELKPESPAEENTKPSEESFKMETEPPNVEMEAAVPENEVVHSPPKPEINEKVKELSPLRDDTKPLLHENFLKACKKNLSEMTRDELEEFCVLKIVESVIDRSSLSEVKAKLKTLTQNMEEYSKKAKMLTKQNRDLQVVLKSVQEDQKKGVDNIVPLKITRSVGMQVLMTDKVVQRRKGIGLPTNAPVNKQLRNPVIQSPRPQKPQAPSIPVPRLVPANNPTLKSPNQPQPATVKIGSPLPNGIRNPSPVQKAEKRTHNRIQSVTVDLTDDEPPAKMVSRAQGPVVPPVRLVPSQNLLAPPRPSTVNSPRKVYIPISGPQAQNVRPGQTIMLKTVPAAGPRQRCPPPHMVRMPQNMRMQRPQGMRHPAPLPDCMKQYQPPNWKALPPAPDLKLAKVENGIVISWKIEGYQEDSYEEIASYQLYAYQETASPPNTALWKKIGDVKALPLPMACTLTQFMAGYKYYFAVRAVDIRSRLGPFSLPGSILLLNKM